VKLAKEKMGEVWGIMRLWVLIAAILSAWCRAGVTEEEPLWRSSLQFHGFLSQGFVYTSNNRWYGDSEKGSPDFTEMGLNLSFRPFGPLRLAAQGVFRRSGQINPNEVRLDYALADYTFFSANQGRIGIMLGRVKNPLGLYNETRDVAFTRPTIFLPQSIYFDRTRNLGLANDGFQLYGEYSTKWGDWFFRAGAGLPNGTKDKEFERLVLGKNWNGEIEPELSAIGRLMYEYQGGMVRLAVTGTMVNTHFKPGKGTPFEDGKIRFNPVIFSAQYNGEKLTLTGEYALRFAKFKNFGPFFPDTSTTGESYYLQASYRILPQVELVGRYDVFFADRDDTSGRKFAERSGRPRYSRFAYDWTAGIRWDITSWWMVRAEYHNVDGVGWLAASENGNYSDTKKNWHMFALLTAFRF